MPSRVLPQDLTAALSGTQAAPQQFASHSRRMGGEGAALAKGTEEEYGRDA